MRTKATSTIAALCYSGATALDFEALVAEFNQALGGCVITRTSMPHNGGDYVTFATPDAQINLAYAKSQSADDQKAPKYHTSFVLSVGTGADTLGIGPIFDQRWQLCGDLINRIEEIYPSDHSLWVEIDEVFSRDVCDRFVSSIWTDGGQTLSFTASMWPYLEPDKILPDLDRRLVDEFSRVGARQVSEPAKKRRAERPKLLPIPEQAASQQPEFVSTRGRGGEEKAAEVDIAEVVSETSVTEQAAASDTDAHTPEQIILPVSAEQPGKNIFSGETDEAAAIVPTHPAMHADRPRRRTPTENLPAVAGPRVAIGDPSTAEEDAILFREALYPPEFAESDAPSSNPLPHRLAIYTMNITLIVMAAPVGAAMMTYCACGRENMNVMARAMALTGVALGFGSTEAGAAIMPFLG